VSQNNALQPLKDIFISYLILRNSNLTKPYIFDTDASKYAIGAVFCQDYPDGRHPIAYFSKLLLDAKMNYNIYDYKLLAIIKAVTAFRYLFLEAQEPFII
jgi:RNase H-like domain found in reverse transcriptase